MIGIRQSRLRSAASGAMAVMALVLVTAGCAQVTPAARAAISVPVSGRPSWQVVKRVPGLSELGFSAVVAVGTNRGWAFDTAAKPTAWERNGSNPNAWTQVPFPGLTGETYSAGHLTVAPLPGGPDKILVNAVALIPGTTSVLASGDTHAAGNPGIDVVAAVLQYRT